MTTVYVLRLLDYDSHVVMGVFASLDDAQSAAPGPWKQRESAQEWEWNLEPCVDWEILPFELGVCREWAYVENWPL